MSHVHPVELIKGIDLKYVAFGKFILGIGASKENKEDTLWVHLPV